MIYFANRQLDIVGQASMKLPSSIRVVDDKKTEEVETGVSVFECKILFTDGTRSKAEEFTALGNHILLKDGDEDKLYTIIEAEIDTFNQEIYIYAEDDGMDLLNEIVGAYEADKAYDIAHYINKYAAHAGFQIGINEVSDLTRKLSWDGESTATARIASIATKFDGCEVSYSFEIDGLRVSKKYINIYKKRGKDVGITLRLNKEIDRIITTKSIANLATALQCTGGTPEDTNLDDDIEPTPITLKGYSYDDGDFYVDTDGVLKSRKALEKWSRFLWKTDDTAKSGGHITKQYSYDTTSQKTLCSHAITELKKICDIEVNYEADITNLPGSVKIGDRINIVDDKGELYLSSRVLKLESSEANQECKITLGEHLIKRSGISEKVAELAEKFAQNSVHVIRATTVGATASTLASSALGNSQAALDAANEAKTAADNALTSVGAVEQTADQASESATSANERVTTAESLIQALSNCIPMLVTDENGESLMTETENGWSFSMKETSEAVSSLSSLLEEVQQESASTLATVDTLKQALEDHGETLEYIAVTTYEDEPCIVLGESDSDFKLLITNTRIMFMNGSNVPTYINTNGLVTQNIEVKGEIVQGGYVMLNTSDGGWGLLWKGVAS